MITKHTLLRQFIERHRQTVGLTLMVGLINSIVAILLPLSLGRFYEQLFGASNRGKLLDNLGLGLVGQGLTSFFILFGGLIIARGLLEYAESHLTGRLSERLAQSLRNRLFAHQLALPLATHQKKAVGKYLLRYGGDFKSVRNYLTRGLLLFTKDVLFLTLAVGVLAYLNALLTVVVVGSTLPFLFIFRWINGKMKNWSQQRRNHRAAYLAFISDRLEGLSAVKVFNREPLEVKKFRQKSQQLTTTGNQHVVWRSLREAMLPVATFTLVAIMLGAIAYANAGGLPRVDGGVLIAFLLLVLNLRPVLRRLLRVGQVWQSGDLSFVGLTALLNHPPEQQPLLNVKLKGRSVAFDTVTFGYDAGRPVLTNVSFVARRGAITHLTGKPGAGKTTLFSLLLKLHNPLAGRVLIDNHDIAGLPVQAVRRAVTLVSDAMPLLGKTVFEAISYSRHPDKRAPAGAVLQWVQAAIELTSPLRLDDRIGDNGAHLSVGQRRVLLLTRAILTRKPVLLLDEPFAGLSAASATRLGQLLNELAQTKVVLLVTNRNTSDLTINQTVCLPADETANPQTAFVYHPN